MIGPWDVAVTNVLTITYQDSAVANRSSIGIDAARAKRDTPSTGSSPDEPKLAERGRSSWGIRSVSWNAWN